MTLSNDLKYAVRMMMKKPAFAMVAIMALALGIAANTAIFSVVYSVLLKSLPYTEAERLVVAWEINPRGNQVTVSPANFTDWREQNTVFSEMAANTSVDFSLSGSGTPERIRGASVSTNFFQLLNAKPLLGQTFQIEKEQTTDWKTVVLSYGLWQRNFGSDPQIIGKSIILNENSYKVIGIMPPEFKWQFLSPNSTSNELAALYVPAIKKDIPQLGTNTERDVSERRSTSYMRVIARLKQGVSMEQAQAEMDTIAARLGAQYPDSNKGRGIRLISLHKHLVRDVRPALLVLLVAVGLVLTIACANVANLFLVRAETRRRELAMRVALGAGRGRLIRQLLTESVLLALIAGCLGLLGALWGVQLLVSLMPNELPPISTVSVDLGVLLFTLGVSILTGIVFGMLPALQVSRVDLTEALKEGAMKGTTNRNRSSRILVVVEVALSLVLLVGAGLFLKSFLLLQQVNPGFEPDNLLSLKISLPDAKYSKPEQQSAFFKELLEKIKTTPGVKDSAAVLNLPFAKDDIYLNFIVEGRPVPPPSEQVNIGYQIISSNYFRTMGIPLLRGRDIAETDREGTENVIILNESAVRKYFPNEDPLNKRVKLRNETTPSLTVIGIVRDVHHHALDIEPRPEGYVSYLQSPFSFSDIVIRTETDPQNVISSVRNAVTEIDKELPIANVQTMNELLAGSMVRERFTSTLAGFFSLVALLLAAIGIYGVISYIVTQRTHEIGIRMALGATKKNVLKIVVWQGMKLTVFGIAIGLFAAFILSRLIESMLFGISANNWTTYLIVAAVLTFVALLACYLPARRAMKVDPIIALRYE